ncbi:MAG: MBL fold metallo-hydrolase [Bacteroidota bacterium]
MALVANFSFNPFQENTYIIHDESKECIIIDPGCYTENERIQLKQFISYNNLKPVRLINTHCHLDHVFGNRFCADTYNLSLEIHEKELQVLNSVPQVCQLYGIPLPDESPQPSRFIKVGETIRFGQTTLETLFTPGHSPGSLSFYCRDSQFVIAGDVLFHEGIGRTDLPGGDYATLINSIRSQLFVLPDETRVYAGHMQSTTVGHEKEHNPFLQ